MHNTITGKRKTSFIGVLAGLSLSALVLSAQAVQIRGVQSCKTWNEDKANQASKAENEAWFLGYLSGLASARNKDFLRDTDSSSLFLWLDTYCQVNINKDIDDGADQLAVELVRQKRL